MRVCNDMHQQDTLNQQYFSGIPTLVSLLNMFKSCSAHAYYHQDIGSRHYHSAILESGSETGERHTAADHVVTSSRT